MLPFIALFLPFLYFLTRRRFPLHFSFDLPSDKPPAVVGHMVNTLNMVTPKEFVATLVDLAYRKKLELKVSEKNELHIRRRSSEGLLDFEKDAINLIMGGGKEIILENVVAVMKTKERLGYFNARFELWKRKVNNHCKKYHTHPRLNMEDIKPYVAAAVSGIVLSVVSYMLLSILYQYPLSSFSVEFDVGVFILLSLLFGHYLLTRFSDLREEVEAEKIKWLQLKETIDKYTAIRTKPPTEHIIWDRLMAYAVVLNSADNVYDISKEFLELKQLYEHRRTMAVFRYFEELPARTVSDIFNFFFR